MEIDYNYYLEKGMTYQEFVNRTPKNKDRLDEVYSNTLIPKELEGKIQKIHCKFTMLVFAENWCSDTVLTLPILVKISELTDKVDLVVVPRDEILEDFHKHFAIDGKAKIPLIIFLIDRSAEIKRWIERTKYVNEEIKKLKQLEMEKTVFYKKTVAFYMKKETIERTTNVLTCEVLNADILACKEAKEFAECEI